ncbi:hypothetical protein RND81_01G080600 [Saponaria officinalis]|uniref:RBR-type E3 ubiquitin transferase n=1 Tax=Saponaria officinalis TaxID=3572 RepID=A0AAW1N6B6_SAPOF
MEYDDDIDNMSYIDECDDYYDDQFMDDNISDDHETTTEKDTKNLFSDSEKPYTILSEEQIKHRQDEEISNVSSILSLSKAESTVLLCHYNWCTSQVHEEWFGNEQLVRNKVGLLLSNSQKSKNKDNNNNSCGICFDDELSSKQIRHASCGHNYCLPCWRKYIDISINERGSGSLLLKCPEPKCAAAIDRDMVTEIASRETVEKYMEYLTRSYVEFKKTNIKWCPGPGCKKAVEFELGISEVYDVMCECMHEFCYQCGEEPHRPVECEVVKEWIMKNSSEAENTKWIMAYSKPCPKCKRHIEKNNGCNHMTCGQPCLHHFCWLCGRSLDGGRNYSCNCNRFRESQANKANDEETQREMAKRSLERYTHYYERWASNNKSRDKARSDLTEMKSVKMHHLCDRLGPECGLKLDFILQAWEQIIECRRFLKWTYAYGFFKLENEDTKRQLFEYIQGEAERALERLHFCAETELKVFCDGEDAVDVDDFSAFRVKLLGLTKVTGTFFDNLVKGLENGLSEVGKAPSEEENASILETEEKNNNNIIIINIDENEEGEYWSCDRCSYLNPERVLTCGMCFEED